jgi:primosomal protein N' (replication factor Y)
VALISVAVPVPFLDLLTYRLPEHLGPAPVGARVRVPLGPRVVTGCVVVGGDEPGLAPSSDQPAVMKDVIEVLDHDPFVPPSVIELCRWVADYYVAGIGDAIGMALPPGARTRASGFKTRRVASVTPEGRAALSTPPAEMTARQREALEVLAASPDGCPVPDLRAHRVSPEMVSRLVARSWAAIRTEAHERDPFGHASGAVSTRSLERPLTGEQARALDTLSGLAREAAFRVALVHGVTGSGKTELYLRLADTVRGMGRRALILVPEIALTPSMVALVRSAFGDRVAIQHSALSAGERHDQWQRIRRGDVDVVVGTRSAVFAPLERLGLVVVDEEHDPSYKQDETPRYHGRDVAILRASREGALVVLGSATPSLESYQHAVSGKYTRVALTHRVLDRLLPTVQVVNMRDEYADAGPDVVISRPLAEAIERRLAAKEQVVVLLNRRGFATSVLCRQCGDTFECPNCSLSLTVHTARRGWRAQCHYCGYATTVPAQCRKCAAPYLEHVGVGTERVEQQLAALFPSARIGRVDRDSIRRKGALITLLRRFGEGDLDVLVGTQMIAKGHDFPRVTLVGVISADVGLGVADFRAAERTFQLLTQVAGRAGRGDTRGEAIVQTLYPEHYSIQLACRQDYVAFFEKELVFSPEHALPPGRGPGERADSRPQPRRRDGHGHRARGPPACVGPGRIVPRARPGAGAAGAPARRASRPAVPQGREARGDAGRPCRRAGGHARVRGDGSRWTWIRSTSSERAATLSGHRRVFAAGNWREDPSIYRNALTAFPCGPAWCSTRLASAGGNHQIAQLDGCRREAQHEHQDGKRRQPLAGGIERHAFVHRAGMTRPEGEEHPDHQHRPRQPRHRHGGHRHQARGGDIGDGGASLTEHRVGDVPTVELRDGEEVERRGNQPEPGGKRHRMHADREAIGHVPEGEPRHRLEEQRLAQLEHHTRELLGHALDSRERHAVEERRHRHQEAGDRAGDADVEERPLVGDWLADPDERAHRADQEEGHGRK